MSDLWADKAKQVVSGLKSSPLPKLSLAKAPKRYADGGETGGQDLETVWNQWRQGLAAGGEAEKEGFARGGLSPEDAELQKRMKAVLREDEQDPERAAAFMKARESYQMPTHERGAYSERVLPMPAHEVAPEVGELPGVSTKAPKPFSWNKFYSLAKGGTLFTLGGDRSNLGRLTHINGKELAWPVDLHAGTKYMTEPNPGAVWANAQTAASALQKKIREAAKKGPVFGVFAPMGPTAVDSSKNMIDTLLAQIPTAGISKKDAKMFDEGLKAGLHVSGSGPVKERNQQKAKEIMKEWPGILNAEKAADFVKKLSGAHRSDIVKYMEKAPFQKAGFPSVGMTRAAITDPELLDAAGNLMGHHVVELHPDKYDPSQLAFEHSTYPVPTKGELVGKLPMIERHVAMPEFAEKQVMDPAILKKTGEPLIIHPYSPNPLGRAAWRGNTEMRQGIQPINERMLESIQAHHGSDFASGGAAKSKKKHPALSIPGVHIVTAEAGEPVFTGEK